MAKTNKKPKAPSSTIVLNKSARHDFHLEDRFEAGMVLEGWEVKSLRAGKVQIRDSHIMIKNGEAWVFNLMITALPTVSTHYTPEQTRPRKLLLNQHELAKLASSVDRKGYTIVPVAMYWSKGRAKIEIALAKGKQDHDKRADSKESDWKREKARILKGH